MTRLKIGKLHDYDRDADGVDMIAISCRGKTRLGRALAAGAHLPSFLSHYGSFNSMAGLIRFLCGDHRDLNREVSGVGFDDALNDTLAPQYEDVVQKYLIQALTTGRGAELGLHQLLCENTLPCFVYHDVDGELTPFKAPDWYTEVLASLAKRQPFVRPPATFWDASVFGPNVVSDSPEEVQKRNLKELQAAYLRQTHGSDEEIDFWVSQEEFNSIPEPLRKTMANNLKIQQRIDGNHIPAPPKKIM